MLVTPNLKFILQVVAGNCLDTRLHKYRRKTLLSFAFPQAWVLDLCLHFSTHLSLSLSVRPSELGAAKPALGLFLGVAVIKLQRESLRL